MKQPRAYDEDFYDRFAESSQRSAEIVVPEIIKLLKPTSVIDVGCGEAVWLPVFAEQGVRVFRNRELSRPLLKFRGGSSDILRDVLHRVGDPQLLITRTKEGHECRHVGVALQAAETLHRFEHAGGDAPQHQLAPRHRLTLRFT